MVSLPQGKPWIQEASPPLPPLGAGYLPIRFLHSLGNGPIGIVPLPSFRWEMNFENVLSMHLDRGKMEKWWTSCNGRHHFDTPSNSNEYMPAFRMFIGETYEKGEMPIAIDCHSLENLKTHQNDPSIPFKCDFAKELFRLMDVAGGDQNNET